MTTPGKARAAVIVASLLIAAVLGYFVGTVSDGGDGMAPVAPAVSTSRSCAPQPQSEFPLAAGEAPLDPGNCRRVRAAQRRLGRAMRPGPTSAGAADEYASPNLRADRSRGTQTR
jgi:hypothetical protein